MIKNIFLFLLFSYFSFAESAIFIRTMPVVSGAEVYLDNIYICMTEKDGTFYYENISIGWHKITVKNDLYEEYNDDIYFNELTNLEILNEKNIF